MVQRFHQNGVRVDVPYLKTLEKDFGAQQSDLEWDLFESIGHSYQDFDGKKYQPFNLSSPDQVERLLFRHLKVQGNDQLQLTKSEKRATTSDDVLEKYRSRHPAIGIILSYRELDKLLGTYVLPLQQWADGESRVHTDFSVTTAATGRLASRRPNLNNIPTRTILGKKIRGAFLASKGNLLISNDMSQIEMRWVAHLAQDPTMMSIFTQDHDIHDRTACEIFGRDLREITRIKKKVKAGDATTAEEAMYKHFTQFERLPSKTLGFGILYGQTAQGLLDSVMLSKDPHWTNQERKKFEDKWTLSECERLIGQWYGVYNKIKEWMELQFNRARRYGMTWDAFGRIRLVPEVYSVHKRIKAEGLRKSGNHAIQASATGSLKIAMAMLDPISETFNSGSSVCLPLLSIHDELLVEASKDIAKDWAEIARECMENGTPISVPIKSSFDVAERWNLLK